MIVIPPVRLLRALALVAALGFLLAASPNAAADFHKKKLLFKKHHHTSFHKNSFRSDFRSGFHSSLRSKRFDRGFHRSGFRNDFRFENRRFSSRFGSRYAHGSFHRDRRFDRHFDRPIIVNPPRTFTRTSPLADGRFYDGQRSVDQAFRDHPVAAPYDAATPLRSMPTAWKLLESGQDARAQLMFGRLASATPNDPRPKVGFGLASALRGQFDRADRAFDRAANLDPDIWDRFADQPVAQAVAADLLAAGVPAVDGWRGPLERLSFDAAASSTAHDYDYDATGKTGTDDAADGR